MNKSGMNGSVQTFTAPVDGIYQAELWGSSGGIIWGGMGRKNQSKGGYTKAYFRYNQGQLIYVIVGGHGEGLQGNEQVGGYNGGGGTRTCPAGAHSATGGGMTHISYTSNVASCSLNVHGRGSWNPNGTIAVAGGGGAGAGWGDYFYEGSDGSLNFMGDCYPNGIEGGLQINKGHLYVTISNPGDAGGLTSNSLWQTRLDRKGMTMTVQGATQNSGYGQGYGQTGQDSGGAGGGWWGGRSSNIDENTRRLNDGATMCGLIGTGGSGHINPSGYQPGYDSQCIGGSYYMPQPEGGNDLGRVGHGYVRITLMQIY